MSDINDNKLVKEIFSISSGDELDVWNDYGNLPPDYSGTIRWKKPSNQNILEVYMAVNYDGNVGGSESFGWLPVAFRPSTTKEIMGMVTYREGTVSTNKFQILNITEDGMFEIYAPATTIIRNMLFYGIINL